jgi:hypothetical protein
MRSVSINPAAAEDGQRPSYSEPVIYSVDKVPIQFKDWAQEQHNRDITITVSAAEDAMRGPNNNGIRSGGLLVAGKPYYIFAAIVAVVIIFALMKR